MGLCGVDSRFGYRATAFLAICLASYCAALGTTARAGTLVNFNFTNFGSVQVDLFDDLVGTTVNNFLQNYVTTGAYSGTMIHRSVPNAIIQGGGYTAATGQAIATAAAIPLQYSRANTRGTIAMARTDDGGDVTQTTTATDQWFFNTVDNTTPLGPAPADPAHSVPQTFGYAVFGWVVGPGMQVVDAIAAVPTYQYNDPFGEVPLQNFSVDQKNAGADPTTHAIVLSSVTVVKTHASFQNPFLAADVNNSNSVTATDALAIINDLLVNKSHTITGPFSGTNYLDPTGDGRVTASDALLVINALLHPSAQASPLAAPAASPMLVVPEPSSFVLGGLAVVGLLFAARRSMSRKRVLAGQ
ncbi:MAG TPA: peptidylprolyl isomerase [Pirellulales bacterium]|jgi:peptidyl-prolyl cis-trans isomerase A (cyclophilin A)|nr:peptidylprolyl isomerase [Pirellulales bacterium]